MNAPTEPLTELPVAQIVALMIAAQLNQPIEDVTPEARLVADLSADELDIMELVTTLEGEFSIVVDDADEHSLATVQGCVDLVNCKLIAAAAPKRHRKNGPSFAKLRACEPGAYSDFGGRSSVILTDERVPMRVAVVQGDDAAAVAVARLFVTATELLDLAHEMEAFSEAAMKDALEEGDALTAETWRVRVERSRQVIEAATGVAA